MGQPALKQQVVLVGVAWTSAGGVSELECALLLTPLDLSICRISWELVKKVDAGPRPTTESKPLGWDASQDA